MICLRNYDSRQQGWEAMGSVPPLKWAELVVDAVLRDKWRTVSHLLFKLRERLRMVSISVCFDLVVIKHGVDFDRNGGGGGVFGFLVVLGDEGLELSLLLN